MFAYTVYVLYDVCFILVIVGVKSSVELVFVYVIMFYKLYMRAYYVTIVTLSLLLLHQQLQIKAMKNDSLKLNFSLVILIITKVLLRECYEKKV